MSPSWSGGVERPANAWDRFYRYQESPWRGERAVAELLPLLGDGAVLELGCGNGKLLGPLQRAGVAVVGLDVSWNVLQRVAGNRVLADAACLPFANGVFTAVLDIHCSGHLMAAGRRAAAAEAKRVLAPGGYCIVERLHPEDLRASKGEAVEGGTRRLQDGRTTHFSDEDGLVAERVAAGFRTVDVSVTKRSPLLRGQQVTRASTRGVFAC